jgi:signal transduction histidine kinase/tetratricopeptide (TPR) repeat protein
MSQRRHRRQILLFLLAVIVPSMVLVALSLRMFGQERELAEKRLLDEQHRRVSDIHQQLLTRLERTKLKEVSALAQPKQAVAAISETPEVVLVGWQEKNQLVLPWDENRAAEEFQRLLAEPDFARRIHQGEQEELEAKQFEKASDFYRQAMNAAHEPAQAAYARLLLARSLARSGGESEAIAHYKKILALSSELVDEQDVPFSLYAAGRLLELGVEHQAVLECVRAELNTNRWMSPTESYILQELANKLAETASDNTIRDAARQTQQQITQRIRELEQAVSLQKDFPDLKLAPIAGDQSRVSEPLWIPYGAETWLVSITNELAGSRSIVVAVQANRALAALDLGNNSAGKIKFISGNGGTGESLGENFPGLRLALDNNQAGQTRRWNPQRSFYLVALLLVLSVTSFGAYLLWLDVRREMRLAELRSQFVSSVSHELKTPLTAIRMFAETLRLGRSTDQQTQAEYLDTIINESERLTRLLNNVLDFSKIEQGKKTYHLAPTSLVEIVRTAARAMAYPLAQQGFELRLDVENNLPAVNADGDALQQAILNLLTNAMKYSGVSREIDLRLQRQNGQAIIQVTDYGVGIAREEQAPIFENFYRVITPESKLIPGTGLGLTLVAHVAKAHGGSVEVQSTPGEGSTFSIRLPLVSGK